MQGPLSVVVDGEAIGVIGARFDTQSTTRKSRWQARGTWSVIRAGVTGRETCERRRLPQGDERMDANKSPRASSTTRLTVVAALALAVSAPTLAQNAPAPRAGATPPPREGNVYDHRDHQPTQAEVNGGEAAVGARRSSSESATQVNDEVKALLEQIDKLDKQSDDDLKSNLSDRQ
jgi:hypothetical protein